jgi:hypothetical protein
MSQGLQVFNANEQLVLDVGNRVIKILTEATLTSGTPATVNFTKSSGTTLNFSALANTTSNFEGNLQPTLSPSTSSVGVTWPAGTITGRTVNFLVMEF